MMRILHRCRPLLLTLLLGVAGALVVADQADARRAGSFGSFGSRGARTYQAPAPTPAAPGAAQPIQRSMTPGQPARPAAQTGAAGAAAAQARRPGMFGGGFLGSMLGGLAVGGLIGMLLGGGFGAFGGMAGMLGGLLQIALIVGGVMLLMRFLRSRQQQPTPAYAGSSNRSAYGLNDAPPAAQRPGQSAIPSVGGGLFGGGAAPSPAANARGADGRWPGDEIGLTDQDLGAFEQLLVEVQEAYGAEDFATLRALTTPEVMGYLAEELGENATKGVRNEVTDVRLLEGDVAEAWREDDAEYATVALHYESRDVTRERAGGRIVEGSEEPSDTHEVWTFVRRGGEAWKLAAIQAA